MLLLLLRRLVRAVSLWGVVVGLLVFTTSGVAGATPVQWTVASGGNGHFYEHVYPAMEWHAAKTFSENRSYLGLQGHLVTDYVCCGGRLPSRQWIDSDRNVDRSLSGSLGARLQRTFGRLALGHR